jgi:hypothetical protein
MYLLGWLVGLEIDIIIHPPVEIRDCLHACISQHTIIGTQTQIELVVTNERTNERTCMLTLLFISVAVTSPNQQTNENLYVLLEIAGIGRALLCQLS